MSRPLKIAVFAPTRWEFNAVRKTLSSQGIHRAKGFSSCVVRDPLKEVRLIQTGMGMHRAWASAQAILTGSRWDLVIATGVAGALVPSQIGTLIMATEVVMNGDKEIRDSLVTRVPCDSTFFQSAVHAAAAAGLSYQQGPVVTVSRVLCTAGEKQNMAERSGAIAVDMESAGIGKVAFTQRIPFLMFRTVSDLSNEDLPVNFNLFHGARGWARGLWSIVSRPCGFPDLLAFKKQTDLALISLSRFFCGFWGELTQPSTQSCAWKA